MAIPSTTVWEFRTTATAGSLNGGGFNAARGGTDYTLQDSAQLTATDLTCTAGSATVTSATGGFTSVMVGNLIHLTALTGTGAIVGWYEIVTFSNSNNVVLDRTPTNGVNNITAGTFYVGGALSLNSTLDDDVFEAIVAGNVVWFKSGSFSLGEAISVAAASATAASNIFVYGYNSTRGDAPTGTNRPSISCGASAIALPANWQVKHLIVTGTAATVFTIGVDSYSENVKALNTSTTTTRIALTVGVGSCVIGCECVSQNGTGLTGASSGLVIGNFFHDSDIGYNPGSSVPSVVDFNLFSGCKTAGYSTSATTIRVPICNNTFYGAEATPIGIGVRSTGATSTSLRMVNNIFYGLSIGIEIATSQQDSVTEDYNCFNNCTTARTNIAIGAHSVTTNPAFAGAAQITGSTATTSGSVLTQSGGDFSSVTDNVDFVRVVSGTGVTVGTYLITSHTGTTLTVNNALGTSGAGNVVYVVYTGQNYLPTGSI